MVNTASFSKTSLSFFFWIFDFIYNFTVWNLRYFHNNNWNKRCWYSFRMFLLYYWYSDKIGIPKPTCFTRSEYNTLTWSVIIACNNVGKNSFVIKSSSCLVYSCILGIVLRKYVNLCTSPWQNAEKAAWGWYLAYPLSLLISSHLALVLLNELFSKYLFMNQCWRKSLIIINSKW